MGLAVLGLAVLGLAVWVYVWVYFSEFASSDCLHIQNVSFLLIRRFLGFILGLEMGLELGFSLGFSLGFRFQAGFHFECPFGFTYVLKTSKSSCFIITCARNCVSGSN